MRTRVPGGFTLIELMTAITLFAILSLLAMPLYTSFMANTHVRNASESMLAGLRLAQTEALKRNGNVEFVLDETTGWKVNDVSDLDDVQLISAAEFAAGAANAYVQPSDTARRVTFNGLGRVLQANAVDNTPPISRIDVRTKFTGIENARSLRLLVPNTGGTAGLRLCDPALPSTDVAGCP